MLRLPLSMLATLTTAMGTLPALQDGGGWGNNVVADVDLANRTAAAAALLLPQAPTDAGAYRLRVTATLISGSGALQVLVPHAGSPPLRFATYAPAEIAGTVTMALTIRGDKVTVDQGGAVPKPVAGEDVPEPEGVAVWCPTGRYRLETVQWQLIDPPGGKAAKKATPAKQKPAKPDPLARLRSQKKWEATLDPDRGQNLPVTVEILSLTDSSLTFAIQKQNKGRHRFECSVQGAKIKVDRVRHTRDPNNGATATIEKEGGSGHVDDNGLVLNYRWRQRHRGAEGTVAGTLTIRFR